tara:strand:+ start:7695 stop:8039 length:345 start_codon:yes stop_codon:yes gene_type:complete
MKKELNLETYLVNLEERLTRIQKEKEALVEQNNELKKSISIFRETAVIKNYGELYENLKNLYKLTKDFISYVEIDPRYIDYPNNHATRLTEAVEQTEKFLMIYDLNEQDTSRFN